MTLRTCSANPRLASWPTIDPTISKAHWMKALPHLSAPFTPCPRRNLQLCVSSLTRTLLQGSSVLLAPPMGHQFFSSRRKMALFDFVSTSEASTESPGKTVTHFHSFLTSSTHQEKHESIKLCTICSCAKPVHTKPY